MLRALFVLVLLVCACGVTPPPSNPAAADCDGRDLAACEKAMLTADPKELPALALRYADGRGDPRWRTLWDALLHGRALWIGDGAPQGVAAVAAPDPPTAVTMEALLLAWGRGAKSRHLFFGGKQLFPIDVLGPNLVALPAIIAAPKTRVPDDVALATALYDTIEAARGFDYIKAAAGADTLRKLADTRSRDDEAAMRALFAVSLLEGAGITLVDERSKEQDADGPRGELSSAYADLLAVVLADGAGEHGSGGQSADELTKRRARITAGMDGKRAAAVAYLYGPREACPSGLSPPIERAADLTFAGLLPAALDPTGVPGAKPAEGKLEVGDWLARYDRLVRLVDKTRSSWLLTSTLLSQRGELFGLSAGASKTYKRVSELAQFHVDALGRLAAAQPARFQTLGVVSLVYQPGVLGDRQLRESLTQLVQKSVALKMEAAADVGGLWEAALAAFAIGMSYPPAMQGAHFAALRQGLHNKLSGNFGKRGGWGIAGLQLGGAIVGLLLGDKNALAGATPHIRSALGKKGTEQPGLAALVSAAVAYTQLDSPDATVANPNLFSGARKKARASLSSAIDRLDGKGPLKPPEKELARRTVDLADSLIVAMVDRMSEDDDATQCAGQSAVARESKFRDTFDRLQRKRRALIEHAAFTAKDGTAWLKRARFIGVVLSDVLDFADQKSGDFDLAITEADAQRMTDEAVADFTKDNWGDVVGGVYLLTRGAFASKRAATSNVMKNATRALNGLGDLFGEGGSLFATLGRISSTATADGDLPAVLTRHARKAYATDNHDEGDLLLMVALGVIIVRDEPMPEASIALAREKKRPVHLPLLMYSRQQKDGGSPESLAKAMRAAIEGSCTAPDPAAVIQTLQAIHAFRRGERARALKMLAQMLDDADARGMAIPRQVFRYEQQRGNKAFNAEQSMSLGHHLLKGSGSFQIGVGMQGGNRQGGRMVVAFAPSDDNKAAAEAARYYAHAAALTSVYQFASGNPKQAVAFARRAIDTWTSGVRLGSKRVPVSTQTIEWTSDATGVLAIAAQQAADAGHAFLAGDLWTLTKASIDKAADDDAVAQLVDPLPLPLRGIAEVEGVKKRALTSLRLLAAKLPCTKNNGDPVALQRVECAAYPHALSMRIADAMPVLPRLKKASAVGKPSCASWRALDAFLGAAGEGRYEPDRLSEAVSTLRKQGRVADAAAVLTRHRHGNHCSPQLVADARGLSVSKELGMHLQADLLSVAANCSGGDDIDLDLIALDELTQRHANPTRNFEVLLFALRHALGTGKWRALHKITQNPKFIQRWHELGPDIARAALLIHHGAAIGSDVDVDKEATLPFYRLFCATFADKDNDMCNTITLLRGAKPSTDKKQAAKSALTAFMQRITSGGRP